MNRMRLVSHYTNYGSGEMWDSSSPVKCVCDSFVFSNKREGKQVALLIEPRPIQPSVYDYMPDHYEEYEYVFTHDSKLLQCLPNAKPILWGNVWCRSENPKKTKLMSMTSSDKELCDLHKERKRIARKYKDKIDVFGTIDGGEWCDPIDTLEPYMYSVVIENYIDDLWFTEKLLNCFATKTIPIYYGARDIRQLFNYNAIIVCDSLEMLEENIEWVVNNPKDAKEICNQDITQEALQENYELSKQYEKFDKWFYNTYKKEIEGLFE